jgi:hypothetical protein
MADLEVLEVVATLDFAHRHMVRLPSSCIRRILKSPEAESVFYGINRCTSTERERGRYHLNSGLSV